MNYVRRSALKFVCGYCNRASISRCSYSSSRTVTEILKTMPKQVDNAELRHLRIGKQQKAMGKCLPASEICLQVLGNGTKGSPRALYVFTDQGKYLFNAGEGTQRMAHEHKAKLSRLEHIFVTYPSWENVGGLPGIALTVQDIGVPHLTLHGPPHIERLFQMTRGFLLTHLIDIEKRSLEAGPYEDSTMRVDYVLLRGSRRHSSRDQKSHDIPEEEFIDDYYDHQRPKPRSLLHDERTKHVTKKLRTDSSEYNDHDISVAFICKPTKKPGQLVLEKCLEQGVPPGPLLGALKNGKDVLLPNGKVVKAESVVSPSQPGPVFIVVECPSIDFVDSLLTADAFHAYQVDGQSDENIAEVVVHFTPSSIMKHEKYQEWMLRFSPSTRHLVLNDENASLCSLAVHRIQQMLYQLHPGIFPLLHEYEAVSQPNPPQSDVILNVRGETMMKYYLRPKKRVDTDLCIKIDPNEYIQECMAVPGFAEALTELKQKLVLSEETSPYPEIVFLGTGSSIPSKVRNTSGIILNLSQGRSMILDCGEGTFLQLHRFYGSSEISSVLRSIKAIFISHLHADHHLGLIQLLKERKEAFSSDGDEAYEPLHLIAPQQIIFWLSSYHQQFEPILDLFQLTGNASIQFPMQAVPAGEYPLLLSKLGLKELCSVPVRHCKHSFGIVIEHLDGWKITYSGDTMPCPLLMEAGKGCDVLIHEATMEDDLQDEAVIKKHSTTSQAIEVGHQMEAKFTLLTHFSQRYAKVPLFNDNFGNNVGIAFDNMKVTLRQLKYLPLFHPALKLMFSEHYEEMKERTAKKLRKKERSNDGHPD